MKYVCLLLFCHVIFFSYGEHLPAYGQEDDTQPSPVKPLYDGVWITRYKNNQKRTQGYHKYGRYNGPFYSWYENGQKQMEGQMRNGKKDGLWIIWGSNGTIKVQEYYRYGKRSWRKEFY
jgi:antitoxin component YwqK of YwqJK toxin-antitoxin module